MGLRTPREFDLGDRWETEPFIGYNLKNDRIISVCFQGKPFYITEVQVDAPTANAKEAEQFYDHLWDLLELSPNKDVLFIIGDWNAKVGSQDKSQDLLQKVTSQACYLE